MRRILRWALVIAAAALVPVGFFAWWVWTHPPDVDEGIDLAATLDAELPERRSFAMGFTYQPYDWSQQAFVETARLVAANGDLITVFDDVGIPWPEAFEGRAYHPNVEEKLRRNAGAIAPQHTVAVVASALGIDRVSLAGYAGATEPMQRPGEWATRGFDSADVATAYINYANRLIDLYDADYFCYIAEANAAFKDADSAAFRGLIGFAQRVYGALKAQHPRLRVCIEFMLGNSEFMAERGDVTAALLPFTDLFAVSTYPFHESEVYGDSRRVPGYWFSQVRAHAGGKPFAVLETAFAAENFMHPTSGIPVRGEKDRLLIPGGPKSQAVYIQRLLSEANALQAEFVNLWAIRDLDALNKLVTKGDTFSDPMWRLPQDTGLLDEDGRERPALQVWRRWLALPIEP